MFFFCSHRSLVDVPLIFFCPADHVPDWQPRVLLGMVEARSVDVKKTTTTSETQKNKNKKECYVSSFDDDVVVVVVFTLKTVLTSIQYPYLSYSSRQGNEFPWSQQANPK